MGIPTNHLPPQKIGCRWHSVRDDEDYLRCLDYIHYNPVKHGLVKSPVGWKYSNVHQYIKDSFYGGDWVDWVNAEIQGAEYYKGHGKRKDQELDYGT
jgi:hypothetical protein